MREGGMGQADARSFTYCRPFQGTALVIIQNFPWFLTQKSQFEILQVVEGQNALTIHVRPSISIAPYTQSWLKHVSFSTRPLLARRHRLVRTTVTSTRSSSKLHRIQRARWRLNRRKNSWTQNILLSSSRLSGSVRKLLRRRNPCDSCWKDMIPSLIVTLYCNETCQRYTITPFWSLLISSTLLLKDRRTWRTSGLSFPFQISYFHLYVETRIIHVIYWDCSSSYQDYNLPIASLHFEIRRQETRHLSALSHSVVLYLMYQWLLKANLVCTP